MELLSLINELGTTMLVVTHEKELVDRLGKRVISIEGGHILSDEQGGYYHYEQHRQPDGQGTGPDDAADKA